MQLLLLALAPPTCGFVARPLALCNASVASGSSMHMGLGSAIRSGAAAVMLPCSGQSVSFHRLYATIQLIEIARRVSCAANRAGAEFAARGEALARLRAAIVERNVQRRHRAALQRQRFYNFLPPPPAHRCRQVAPAPQAMKWTTDLYLKGLGVLELVENAQQVLEDWLHRKRRRHGGLAGKVGAACREPQAGVF